MRRIEPVIELLRERGHRMTSQRRAIVDVVMRTKGHITPPDVVQSVKKKVPSVDESTVYRTLALLEEVGVLSHAHLHGGPEYHHVDAHDHVHLACSNCGSDLYLAVRDTAKMRKALEDQIGFEADFTHFAIAGTCETCLRKARGARTKGRSRKAVRGGGRS
jgi:Fur family ferric uptake transcriptional regulator